MQFIGLIDKIHIDHLDLEKKISWYNEQTQWLVLSE